MQQGLENRIGLEALIETALGMAMLRRLHAMARQDDWKRCTLELRLCGQ